MQNEPTVKKKKPSTRDTQKQSKAHKKVEIKQNTMAKDSVLQKFSLYRSRYISSKYCNTKMQ